MAIQCPQLGTTIGDSFPIGAWVATYRDRGRQGELGPDQQAALESVPGWT